jgi:hypothetical protein
MIAFLRRRRAQANRHPWDSQLTEWAERSREERAQRTEKGWAALRRWLPSGRES